MTSTSLRRIATIALAFGTASAHAQPHSGDITLTIANDAIVTNNVAGPNRVFTTRLGTSFPDFTDSPGFDCAPLTFPSGTRNGFRIAGPLRKWNGTEFPSTPPTEQLELAFASLSRVTPTTAVEVEGFTLLVGSNGQWHRHLEFTLLAPASDGLYLLELSLFSTRPGLNPSDHFWIIFSQNAGTADEALAESWVRNSLIGSSCPGDWDEDGDTDSDDIVQFFGAWDSGEADVDSDADTDSDDIIAFFFSWDGGC